MNDARRRLLLLVALAIIGITLAGAGVALGIGDAIAGDPMGEVSISGTSVTVADSDGDVVLAENVSETSDVEVSEEGDRVTITEQTDEDNQLTRLDRQHAVEIARTNTTVESYLETVVNPTISVEPIEKIDTTEMETQAIEVDVNGTNDTMRSGETVQIENVTVDESSDSVTIDREPLYVEDQAVVRIGSGDMQTPRYSLQVDLSNETVVDITERKTSNK